MAAVATGLAPLGYPNDDTHNVYFTDIDESLPDGDPRRLRVRSAQKAVAMDLLPDDFGVKRVYAWDGSPGSWRRRCPRSGCTGRRTPSTAAT
jgi:hypothetical protein